MAKRVFNADDIEPRIKSFLGLNTIAREDTLEDGELRKATNVDIDNKNKIRMRSGSESVYTGTDCHSGWSDGVKAFFVEGSTLKQLNPDLTTSTILTDLQLNKPMAFNDVGGVVYFSNGVDKGRIVSSVYTTWGIQPPNRIPTIATSTGALPAGKYGLTLTYVRADGSESGAPEAAFFESTVDFTLQLSSIPTAVEVAMVRIYMTTANGEVFYLADEILAGVANRSISSARLTIPLRSYMVEPPPAMDLIDDYRARMYGAKGNYIYYSDAYAMEWFKPHEWFFRMTEDVTLLGAVETGLFVSADKTYFISFNEPNESSIITVAPYKAIKGTMVRVSGSVLEQNLGDKPVLLWRSERGICLGSADGQFLNLTESKYADNISALVGAGLFREIEGASQFITIAKKSTTENSFKSADIVVAEVVRNGILIT